MIRKIQIENFMAHKATSLELSPGVTVVTGPNNVGKSAIVEAIRYLVYNPSPKNVIRHGAKKAVVRLELDSGEIITWQRQDKNASYTIQRPDQEDGQVELPLEEYHKFGRVVPDDVRSLLCLEQVETDTENTEKIDIHLGNQRQPIFLLDRPGSHAAAFFAASTEADYLIKMQQALKRRIDQSKATRKILDTELAALARQLSHYEPLDELEDGIKQVESLYSEIIETEQQLPLLGAIISRIREAQAQLTSARNSGTVLGFIEGPPALEDITGLDLVLSELEDKTRLQRREAARTSVFSGLTSPPALAATADLESLLVTYQANQARHDLASDREQVLSGLAARPTLLAITELADLIYSFQVNNTQHQEASYLTEVLARTQMPPTLEPVWELPGLIDDLAEHLDKTMTLQRRQLTLHQLLLPPAIFDVSLLNALFAELGREQDRYVHLQRLTHLLARVAPPPETATVLDLEHSLAALIQGEADFTRQQARLAGLTLQLDRKKAEIQAYLQDTGLCPLCGSPLDLEHFLEKQHV